MFNKIIHLDPYFPTGELTIQPAVLWANGRPCYEGISKHASVSTEYFKTITPVPGHSFVYVLAVSAWEAYGENRNGDAFPEFPYREDANPPWISSKDVLTAHYKSFEQYGNVFKHHQNSNPQNAIGKIVKAFWNPSMHRIELLLDIDNTKAPDLAERFSSGEFPATSMGCRVQYDVCFLPGTLVRTTTGNKKIEEIQVGEEVRTHTGKLKKVTACFQHNTKEYTTLQGWGTLPIEVTPNHPFRVIRREHVHTTKKVAKPKTRIKDKRIFSREVTHNPEWLSVSQLQCHDFIGIPLDSSRDTNTVGTAYAYIFGCYVGDGCPHYYVYKDKKTPTQVVLSLNIEDTEIRERIETNARSLIPPDKIREYPYKKAGEIVGGYNTGKPTKGTRLYLNDRTLIAQCVTHGGTGSRTKRLAEEVFTWSREEKLHLLGGYIDTDGCYSAKHNDISISTINRGLAIDVQRLALSLGISLSIQWTPRSSHGYTLYIPAAYSERLAKYSVKVQPIPNKRAPALKSFFYDNYWWTPIRKLEEHFLPAVVHNLSVQDDESYLANGIAVHNCTICGNRAPTRAQYCDHLKYQMRSIIDGKKVGALNPSPKFFDQSFVFRPADPIAFMMKKVANDRPYELSGAAAGEYLDKVSQIKDAARKMAVIDKVVQGLPVDAKTYGVDPTELSNLEKMRGTVSLMGNSMPELPDNLLRELSQHPTPKVLSTMMATNGMSLSTPEIVKITIYKFYPKNKIDDSVIDRTVAAQNGILGLFQDFPQILDKIRETGVLDMGTEHVDSKIASLLSPYMEKRSGIPAYLKRQLIPEEWRDVSPKTQQLTITDPSSGSQYGTTVGAAENAHDEIAKANLKKVVGGAALLGGAYKLIGSGLEHTNMGKLKPLAALGLGALGVSQWPTMGKHYMTDQGVPVPTMTELAKVSTAHPASLALPLLGTLGTMALMSHDYQSRLKSGIPIGYEGQPFSRRLLDKVESFSDAHPLTTGLLGTVALRRLGKTAPAKVLSSRAKKIWEPISETARGARSRLRDIVETEKLSEYVGSAVHPAEGTVILPEVDLEKLSMLLGSLIIGDNE